MGRTVSIGAQRFSDLRENGYFFVDKTAFIREWWEAGDPVTLICRPRRFGKTLNMSMVECFFSMEYADRGSLLFDGLEVWNDSAYRALQGTKPVVALSFADCKGSKDIILSKMRTELRRVVGVHDYLLESDAVDAGTRAFLARVSDDMDVATATGCLKQLCIALEAHWRVKPLVLLDEYDAPMQEAWLGGWWEDAIEFQRPLFSSTFKANPSLGRALITGVTRVSRDSIFSDLNNLEVATSTSDLYAESFGFTESEVREAMDEMGLDDWQGVKEWYDGFTFGRVHDIYNPWSITSYLDKGRLALYWANTSSNALVSRLVRTGGHRLQHDFGILLEGGSVARRVDDQVVFGELTGNSDAVWSLLIATGYLNVVMRTFGEEDETTFAVTNLETRLCLERMVRGWFDRDADSYSDFVRALLACDLQEANRWLSDVLEGTIGSFDGGRQGGGSSASENFYHGLVLGMLVGLRGRYEVTSNRESGYGRYDVMLCPLESRDYAFVLEFKVRDAQCESSLEDTARRALAQVREKGYARQLEERGIATTRIREVAFAFEGKRVLIVQSERDVGGRMTQVGQMP